MVRRTFAGAAAVALIVGLTACDGDGRALTAPGLEESSAGDRSVGPVPELPAISVVEGFAELEISVRLRSVGVPFPGADEIGVCHTQVSKRQRPVPFETGRLEVDVPEAARDEAAGRSLLVEYRLRARNGLLLEAVRCRVPRSRLAVEHVFAQFSKGNGTRESAPVSAASSAGDTGSADGWTIRIGPGSPLQQSLRWRLPIALMDGGDGSGPDPCAPSPDDPQDPEEAPEEVCELEGVVNDGHQSCDNPFHEYDLELEECRCPNGSEAEDCWLEGDGPGDGDDPPDDPPVGGGGGGAGDDPEPGPDSPDCAGVVGGSAYIDGCGSCVGGTTGFTSCCACPGTAIGRVLIHEGGFVNHPSDPGGMTNWGIAWRTWLAHAQPVLGKSPTESNLQQLTQEDAALIYEQMYWTQSGAGGFDDGDLAVMHFDFYVNAPVASAKLLQTVLGSLGYPVTVDGLIGPQTSSAVKEAIDAGLHVELYNAYRDARIHWYSTEPHPAFRQGLINRAESFPQKTETEDRNVLCHDYD